MAVLAVAGQSTAAIGLPIGGLLIGLAGWRATFLANVPLALAGIAAALAWLPADRGRHHDDPPRRLDLVGIALFAVAVTSLLVFLEQLKPARWWVAAVSVGATAVLVVHELRFEDPFIDVRMLARSGGLRRTYIRNGLSFVAIYTVLYGMSQWLESARDLSPQQCGIVLLPMIVVSGLASLAIARFDVVQPGLVLAGVAISAGGLLLLLCSRESPIVLIYAVTVVFGVGMGCTFIANQLALYQQAEGRDIAVATGLLRTSSYVAAIFSSSVIGFAFNGHGEQQGLRVLAWLTAGVGVLVALSSALDPALNPGKPASKAATG
jgi:predicted MFS family arabinose efflux permease